VVDTEHEGPPREKAAPLVEQPLRDHDVQRIVAAPVPDEAPESKRGGEEDDEREQAPLVGGHPRACRSRPVGPIASWTIGVRRRPIWLAMRACGIHRRASTNRLPRSADANAPSYRSHGSERDDDPCRLARRTRRGPAVERASTQQERLRA